MKQQQQRKFQLWKHCLLVMHDRDYPARTVLPKGLIDQVLNAHTCKTNFGIQNYGTAEAIRNSQGNFLKAIQFLF